MTPTPPPALSEEEIAELREKWLRLPEWITHANVPLPTLRALLVVAERAAKARAPGAIATTLAARIEHAKVEHEKMGHPGEAALVLSVSEASALLSCAYQLEEAREYEQDLNAVERALGQAPEDERTIAELAADSARRAAALEAFLAEHGEAVELGMAAGRREAERNEWPAHEAETRAALEAFRKLRGPR